MTPAADVMAKVRQGEREGIIFPKGAPQMLAFVFAMDGEVYRRLTWHARMIELKGEMESGYLREFDPKKINFTGYSPQEVNGECALKRKQVAELLFGTIEFAAVLAKYGRDEKEYTAISVGLMGDALREYFLRGRYSAERSKKYCEDLIWSECCGAVRWGKYNVVAISKRHHVAHQHVSRDVSRARGFINEALKRAYNKIEESIGGDGVLC